MSSNYPPGVSGAEDHLTGAQDEKWEELVDWLIETGLEPEEIKRRVHSDQAQQAGHAVQEHYGEALSEMAEQPASEERVCRWKGPPTTHPLDAEILFTECGHEIHVNAGVLLSVLRAGKCEYCGGRIVEAE